MTRSWTRYALAIMVCAPIGFAWAGASNDDAETWLHPKCFSLPCDMLGPYVRLGDGAILAVDGDQAMISHDEGKSWEGTPLLPPSRMGKVFQISECRAIVRTREGTVILAFTNVNEALWRWNAETKEASGRSPLYVTRSLDDGKTWQDPQMLHEAWTGDIRDMIETRDGHVVISTMNMLSEPTRHAIVTYCSDDQGETWTRSNIIDLGGHGHHGGVMEATIEELRDGRVWMLIRTNWDRYWEAFSTDHGASWRVIRPSHISASSSPAKLARLASGRLVLVWNQLYPEGADTYARRGGDDTWAEVAACYHREELSIAFSDDDGQTWTPPTVIARRPKAWLSYPQVFEFQPGVLWITTQQGGLRFGLHESEFLSDERVSLDAEKRNMHTQE